MGSPLQHWQPRALIESVAAANHDDFVADRSGAPYLLVRLTDHGGDLESGLLAGATGNLSSDGLAFATVVGDTRELMRQMQERQQAARRRRVDGNADRITDTMLADSYFIAAVQKRDGTHDDFVRVSVGRARNQDIVLRHDSVSKFHAWLDREPDGSLYVRDADSKNRTLINGETAPSARTLLAYGDRLTFGSVETMLCSPGALWDALVSA